MREVTIPSVGMAMTEAVLTVWLKNPGDTVAAGEMLAEIETDKSALELESPSDGVLGRHLVSSGATVPVGEVIVRILMPGEIEPGADAAPAEVDSRVGDTAAALSTRSEIALAGPDDRVPHQLSPRKRQQLREQAEAAGKATSGVQVPRFRSAIAEHVSESWRTIPHFAVVRDINAEGAQRSLAVMRGDGLPATITDVLLHAFARALNTAGDATGDLGLAVATPDGVVIPVVAGVSALGPAALVADRTSAVSRARGGRLSAEDLAARPLASLSNLGGLGVDSFTGVIPVGQRLLLTTGRIVDRPVVVNGRVEVRPSVMATLNVDHRHFDGDGAARMLESFQVALSQSFAWARGETR